jgi:ribosomal protein S18 acetylase RimI-like enzyme
VLEFRTVGLWSARDADQPAVGQLLLRDTLERVLPPGHLTVDGRVNPHTGEDVAVRLALYERAGYRVFQEKEGFLWSAATTDSVDPALTRARLTFRTVDEVGEEAFAEVMSRSVAGTLDRNDVYYRDLVGPRGWGREMLGYLEPEDRRSWLIASTPAGVTAGYVFVAAFELPGRGTIGHIGVVPEERGNRYVDELLQAANRVARERGYSSMLSDVDVQNAPMLAAMERAGHRASATSWHSWHFRLDVEA